MGLHACLLDLDMYHGNKIRDEFCLVNQNPGWILSCKSEARISGISGFNKITWIGTGLKFPLIPFVHTNDKILFCLGKVSNSSC